MKTPRIDAVILSMAQELCNEHDWTVRDPGVRCRGKAPTTISQIKREFARVCRKHIKKIVDPCLW